MKEYKNEYNLKVVLNNNAKTPEEAEARSLLQISNIQVNLANSFTKTSLVLNDKEE